MITSVVTADIHDGKLADAFAWAAKAAGYVSKQLGTNLQIARNIGGLLYQVHFVSTFASLAEFEQFSNKLQADPGYQELVTQARQEELLIGRSIVTHLYESVP